ANSDTSSTLQDATIVHTQPRQTDLTYGWGIAVQDGAVLEGERLRVSHNHDVGLFMAEPGAQATFKDLTLTDTQPQQSDMNYGRGVSIQSGAVLEGERLRVSHNHELGLFVADEGTRATFKDLIVTETQPQQSNLTGGAAIAVQVGAVLEGERLFLSHNHDLGLFVANPGTRAMVHDLIVTDIQPQQSDRANGRGISVQSGGVFEGERVLLSHNYEVGLFVARQGTQATVRDLTTIHTQPRVFDDRGGTAVVVIEQATAHLEWFELTDNALAGLLVASGGSLTGQQGTVRDNFVGLNIQTDPFDLNGLDCVDIGFNCCGMSCEVSNCNVEYRDRPTPEASELIGAVGIDR
ncbi:MAG: hypothetical protein AAFX99_15760, partial [Myxococcota bacterium]